MSAFLEFNEDFNRCLDSNWLQEERCTTYFAFPPEYITSGERLFTVYSRREIFFLDKLALHLRLALYSLVSRLQFDTALTLPTG